MAEQSAQQKAAEKFETEFSYDENVSGGMPWRLMIFTFILFIFAVFISLGLRLGYVTFLDSQISIVDEQIESLAAQLSEGVQEEFLIFHSQLVNLEAVLGERGFSRNVFGFLEKNTLPLVYYTDAEYSFDDYSFSISGQANSMRTLVEQMTVFDEAPELERVILDLVNQQESQVSFTLRLIFQPKFFESPI